MSPSLSQIQGAAAQVLGHIPESRRHDLQDQIVALCEQHWSALRGSQPLTQLAQTLWSITPPLVDLLIDLYVNANTKLLDLLPGQSLARGLALLVLAEIERGNEAGVHLVHEPMMVFESIGPDPDWLARSNALFIGRMEPPLIHPHDRHGVLWRALAVISAHTRRLDLPAILAVIRLLTVVADPRHVLPDPELDALRNAVAETGIRFLSSEGDEIHFAQHEHVHAPVRSRQLGEMLQELRQLWLAQ
ncbi:MAG: hypothetical protein P8Z75_09370 [Gammaproteobacteria bacterium]